MNTSHQANRDILHRGDTIFISRNLRERMTACFRSRMLSHVIVHRLAAFHGNENICRSAGRLRRAREVAEEEGETRQWWKINYGRSRRHGRFLRAGSSAALFLALRVFPSSLPLPPPVRPNTFPGP